jgi:N-acetyl-alpha-D-muramate 1-phosphate uridylyltransferase
LKAEAMILAAGRGERMRPLTDAKPKPLLEVDGKPLIEWHLQALAAAGIHRVVINTAWLEEQIPAALGNGSRWGMEIEYSMEGRDHGGALETAGGIAKALPLLADAFWLVSADIHAPDFRFESDVMAGFARTNRLAHLWLVPNPSFHAQGDFGIGAGGMGLADGPGPDGRMWTYANIALIRADLCAHIAPGQHAALGPLLFERMREGQISVERYDGEWHNIGTPAQLEGLQPKRQAAGF